jgi:hypothetical protein
LLAPGAEWFVTPLKTAAVYTVQGRVERDQVIRLTGVGAEEKCPHELRLALEVQRGEHDEQRTGGT